MKKAKDMLNEIKNLLGVELSEEKTISLEKLNLENGTVIESEDFNTGSEVFILTEDQKVALPIGEYKLEDGRILQIEEEGIVKELKSEELEEEDEAQDSAELNYATKEELGEVISMVEEIKKMIEENMMDHKEEEMSEAEELKEELSKPAAEPLTHSPETTKKELNLNLYSQDRPKTTMDRILEGIANIKHNN